MREHFRTFDSKITFFAFADIITAVSGMLVFITLLLATDLGRPSAANSLSSKVEQQVRETLAEQADADAEIERLQHLLAAAEVAPDTEKLESDIAKLRLQLSQEQAKEAVLDGQMANSQAAIAARDRSLGLTDLKATIENTVKEVQSIADKDAKARVEMNGLEQQVLHAQDQLLKLRRREGQLWLIPDRTKTTKEPILVTVSGAGITVDRFDRPDQHAEADSGGARDVFTAYLAKAKSTDQYVVFLIKPSGIPLFQSLVQSARDKDFDVGYDALEENQQVHFSTPPPIDEPVTSTKNPGTTVLPSSNSNNSTPAASQPNSSKPRATAARSAPSPKSKSWWQKLLECLGLE
jgi:hypothetical protein